MIPIVNDKYRYILYYSAKVGSSALRELYMALHANEFSQEQKAQLNVYHNLNEVCCLRPEQDYSDYFSFLITRNPYSRIISGFMDQYVYSRNPSLVNEHCLNESKVNTPHNFHEFLTILKSIPDEQRDIHFQTQSYIEKNKLNQSESYEKLDYVGDIKMLNKHLSNVYQHIFQNAREQYQIVEQSIQDSAKVLSKRNSIYYSDDSYAEAWWISITDLNEMIVAPKPQDFYQNDQVRDLVWQIYQRDFEEFGYDKEIIPQKSASNELDLLPQNFDWQTYIELNPDLAPEDIYNERGVVRHYLEFGRFESIPRSFQVIAPSGFDWQHYLEKYSDLPASGIQDERAAIVHYLGYGIREGREF